MAAECGPKGGYFRFAGTINDQEVQLLELQFNDWIDKTEDLTPVFKELDREYALEIQKQFNTEGSYSGHPWPGLSKSTRKARARMNYGESGPILVRTGDLKNSLTRRDDVNAIRVVTPRMWQYGTKIPYAIFHQSTSPRRRLPRRPMLFVSAAFRLFVVRRFHEFIKSRRVPRL